MANEFWMVTEAPAWCPICRAWDRIGRFLWGLSFEGWTGTCEVCGATVEEAREILDAIKALETASQNREEELLREPIGVLV